MFDLFKETENRYYRNFDNDYLLLIILILLEKYHCKPEEKNSFTIDNIFNLNDFIKDDPSKIEEINNELNDTNDFSGTNDYILNRILNAGEELDLFKIRQIGVFNLDEMLDKVLEKAIENDKKFPRETDYYHSVIDEIFKLKILEEKKYNELIKNNRLTTDELHKPLFFEGGYEKNIGLLIDIVPENIYFRITYIDKEVKIIEKEIGNFIHKFSTDLYKNYRSGYSETGRIYFAKQIENFYTFINDLPLIKNTINIPFLSLENKGFEIVKILKYLEINKKIKVNKWDDENFWKVDFLNLPITIDSLIKDKAEAQNTKIKKTIFKNGILHFQNKELNFDKRPIQKDLLNTLFKKPKYKWTNDEIWEDWGENDLKPKTLKFYTASDEINKTIALDTGIRDFLIKSTKQIQINPKYTE